MRIGPLLETDGLGLVIEPERPAEGRLEALCDWVAGERANVHERLASRAALLLRGFELADAEDFRRCCGAFEPQLRRYVGGESPRTAIRDGVYTSTEYPPHLEIALHSEMSYAHDWPRRLYFFCETPAASGGETPIADTRRILSAIAPAVAQRFEAHGVMYISNYHCGWGLGKSWQETFLTADPLAVEQLLEAAGVEFRWTDGGLWTRSVRPAIIRHPVTGERVWFNQADRWHVSARGEAAARKLLRVMDEQALPRHARYGDGAAIEPGDLDSVRAAYRAAEQRFTWRRGDLLVLDNVLTAHGRRPFTGERRVLVAMA